MRTISQHELLAPELAITNEVGALLHEMVDALIMLDHVGRNAIVRISKAIVHNEQVWVDRRRVRVAGHRQKSETPTSVGAVLLAWDETSLVNVHFEDLDGAALACPLERRLVLDIPIHSRGRA